MRKVARGVAIPTENHQNPVCFLVLLYFTVVLASGFAVPAVMRMHCFIRLDKAPCMQHGAFNIVSFSQYNPLNIFKIQMCFLN